jgi:hypothetical protein
MYNLIGGTSHRISSYLLSRDPHKLYASAVKMQCLLINSCEYIACGRVSFGCCCSRATFSSVSARRIVIFIDSPREHTYIGLPALLIGALQGKIALY